MYPFRKTTRLLLAATFLTAMPQLAVAASPATQTSSKVFNAHSFVLDNGLKVIVVPNDRVPAVTQMVWYKVGAAYEPKGKSGIAHFLEHLMFKGSKVIGEDDLPAGEFSKKIKRLGGRDNAFTSQDYTAYFQSAPSDALETIMRMEAGRMNGMLLPKDEVTSERKVIVEERKQRTDNNPEARFFEQIRANLYLNHPYGTPVIGWKHEMEELSHKDAVDFYKKWYAPNNAFLIVSGDVTPADVFSKAIKIYGAIPKADLPKLAYTQSPPMDASPRLIMRDEQVKEPGVYKVYRTPSAVQDKDAALALDVLSEIMGGGSSARIYQSLVVEQKLASNAGFSYSGTVRSDADLYLYATPLPGVAPERIEEALNAEIQKLLKSGVSEAELQDAKTRMQDSAIYARDSLAGPAMIIGRALASGLSLDDVEYWPRDISKVSREDILKAAQDHLDEDKAATPPIVGFLLPKEGN
ncbi:MAG: peptidase M16 [Micavibrio sp.]|nr:peptidase M16 [Micavibrio sp.]|tara:strand:+ start:1239 stop:2636 length:1398 start_codon:yes stop_codon:yes gene_type:complete